MLSKAEIAYLEGRKQVSNSYERKLKCLIRKKIEVLEKEIPLLSNIFAENIKSILSEIWDEKDESPQFLEQEEIDDYTPYSSARNAATEFSTMSLRNKGIEDTNLADCEGLEGLKYSPNPQNIAEATIFGNAQDKYATKNSNPNETLTMDSYPTSNSTYDTNSYKNFNKLVDNSLISTWAESYVGHICL